MIVIPWLWRWLIILILSYPLAVRGDYNLMIVLCCWLVACFVAWTWGKRMK